MTTKQQLRYDAFARCGPLKGNRIRIIGTLDDCTLFAREFDGHIKPYYNLCQILIGKKSTYACARELIETMNLGQNSENLSIDDITRLISIAREFGMRSKTY